MEDTLKGLLFDPLTGKIIAGLITVLLLAVLIKLFKSAAGRYITNSDTRYRIRKFIMFTGYCVGAVTLAAIFSDRLRSFTVAFGVAGAGVAFALQEVIASVAGWLAIALGGIYSISDRIQLGGIRGDVIDIGILRTTLMECGEWVHGDLYNGRIVRISNSFVFKQPVFNYSASFPFLWDEIVIPVKYGSDYQLARKIIQKVAKEMVGEYAEQYHNAWQDVSREFKIETQRLEPIVTLEANSNWLEFTLRYVVDYKLRRITRDRLFQEILEAIDATGKKVGIAASTLNIEKLVIDQIPLLDVNLRSQVEIKEQAKE